MKMDRRSLIRGIGAAIISGYAPPFLPKLLPKEVVGGWLPASAKVTLDNLSPAYRMEYVSLLAESGLVRLPLKAWD